MVSTTSDYLKAASLKQLLVGNGGWDVYSKDRRGNKELPAAQVQLAFNRWSRPLNDLVQQDGTLLKILFKTSLSLESYLTIYSYRTLYLIITVTNKE